jgi:dCTP deaminase
MLLADHQIRDLCVGTPYPLLEPFSEAVSGDGLISYGLSHCGYDLRLGGVILVFNNSLGEVVDPKRFKDPIYRDRVFTRVTQESGAVIIPAGGYALGASLEYFRMPNTLAGRVTGKSTYARCGLIVNVTTIEPGWNGNLTLEISNSGPCPAAIYPSEGIAQVHFERLDRVPETTYRGKKYDNQEGVTVARVL